MSYAGIDLAISILVHSAINFASLFVGDEAIALMNHRLSSGIPVRKYAQSDKARHSGAKSAGLVCLHAIYFSAEDIRGYLTYDLACASAARKSYAFDFLMRALFPYSQVPRATQNRCLR